ncbi:MAG: hypothetical protein IH571_05920, partial [Acholeplasmataceae bacterium]|nr:hypothetical protein [Acholeplasmataceae bacterium]
MIELVAQIVLYTFLMVSFLLLSTILLQKRVNIRKSLKSGFARDYLFKRYFDYEEAEKQFSNRFFFDAFIEVETQVSIDPVARSLIVSDLMATGFCMKQFKRLHRHGKNKRKIASFYLGALKHEEAYLALQKQLKREKDDSVRFYIFYALREIMDEENLNVMINSLSGSRESYQTWIRAVLNNNFDRVEPYLESYVSNPSIEVKRLMLYLASNQLNPTLKAYAINTFKTPNSEPEIRQRAIEALSLKYPEEMSTMDFCNHEDEMVKRLAIKSSSTIITEEMVDRLLITMDGSHLDDLRIQSLSRIVFESKSLL